MIEKALEKPLLLTGSVVPGSADPQRRRGNLFVLSNQLTALRLVLSLLLFTLLIICGGVDDQQGRRLLNVAFGVFVVAGLTDWLDGWVARYMNTVTAFGRLMDPLLDKVLVCGALVLLSGPSFARNGESLTGLAPWMTVVVVTREFLVTGFRSFSESRRTPFGSAPSGKLKMVLQCTLVGWLLFALANCREPGPDGALVPWARTLSSVLILASLVSTVYSGLTYWERSWRLISDGEDSPTVGIDATQESLPRELSEQPGGTQPVNATAARVRLGSRLSRLALLVFLALAGCSGRTDSPATPPPIRYWQAALMGFTEGLTEYLPVSSTGHLVLLDELLGLRDGAELTEPQIRAVKAYEIVIQFGAILAVFLVYAERVGTMTLGLLGQSAPGRRLLVNLICAFAPAAALGLVLDKLGVIERLQHIGPVIAATLVGGVAMILFERSHHAGKVRSSGMRLEDLTPQTAVVIGLAQCLSLWPGTSRSMTTMLAGMLVGLSPVAAAEFSFLLGLATLSAASLWKLRKEGAVLQAEVGLDVMLLGMLVALVTAAAAVTTFTAYLSRRGLEPFGWYRIGLALVLLGILGVRGRC